MHGASTSGVEVTHVSQHGFWLLLKDEELLVPFSEFPWFKDVTIDQLSKVELPSENHLYWPQWILIFAWIPSGIQRLSRWSLKARRGAKI